MSHQNKMWNKYVVIYPSFIYFRAAWLDSTTDYWAEWSKLMFTCSQSSYWNNARTSSWVNTSNSEVTDLCFQMCLEANDPPEWFQNIFFCNAQFYLFFQPSVLRSGEHWIFASQMQQMKLKIMWSIYILWKNIMTHYTIMIL